MKLNGKFKKIIGVALIVTFAGFILTTLITLGMLIMDQGYKEEIGTVAFSFIFVIVLCCFPLQYGIRLWKSGVSDLIEIPIVTDRTIVTSAIQMSFQEYRSLIVKLTIRTPLMLYVFFLGVTFLTGSLLMFRSSPWISLIMGIVFMSIPLLSILQAKKNYNAAKNLTERMVYEFNADNIIVTGETFNSTFRWTSLYKVVELNDWLLLYTNKIVAVCIPKSAFKSPDDLNSVKAFALNAQGVKKELKL